MIHAWCIVLIPQVHITLLYHVLVNVSPCINETDNIISNTTMNKMSTVNQTMTNLHIGDTKYSSTKQLCREWIFDLAVTHADDAVI